MKWVKLLSGGLALFAMAALAGCTNTVEPIPVRVGSARAAEDEKYVYFLAADKYEDGRDFVDSQLLIYDRESGIVVGTSAESQLLALADGKLYLSQMNDTDITVVAASDLVANPDGWQKYASESSDAGVETFTHDLAVYGERLAFASGTSILGDISSVSLDFTDAELFSETRRFLAGWDGEFYYYLEVRPELILTQAELENGDDVDYAAARRCEFVLTRVEGGNDSELFTLLVADSGAFSHNSFAAIYDGYVYYPDVSGYSGETGLLRRRLDVDSEPEVVYSDYEENERFAGESLPLAYEIDGGFILHELATLAPQPESNLMAVTVDGVYIRKNDGTIIRVAHDGSSALELAHGYSETERYFVSEADGRFKYVSRSGYGIVE